MAVSTIGIRSNVVPRTWRMLPRSKPPFPPGRAQCRQRYLLDRDFLVDLVDIDALAAAVGAEAEVDGGSQHVD